MYPLVLLHILVLSAMLCHAEVGDLGLAYQAFKIAVSVDPNHAESYNNIGVLELRKAVQHGGGRAQNG